MYPHSVQGRLEAALPGILTILIAFPLPQAKAVETYMVPMRDGVRLATDVYLPAGQGPWPTVLVRTPYGRFKIDELNNQGYVVVTQDLRGYFGSEGTRMPFDSDGWGELQDGYDTVEWIASQSWSNGKVGTWGGSALGITQNLLAGSYPPHLVCQHIMAGASDLYSQMFFPGGVFLKSMVESWWAVHGRPEHLADLLSHPDYDSRWEFLNSEERVGGMEYPGFHIGGWYDIFLQGTINAFVERQYSGGPDSRGNQKLVIGPWWHGGFGSRTQGELTFPTNSLYPDLWPDTIRFYDFWLKGQDNGYTSLPTVRYYVMGDVDDPGAPGNGWRTADGWPIEHVNLSLYLCEDGLSTQPGTSGAKSYIYDPKNPVPTVGGANLVLPSGPMDQRKVEGRPDVLVFTSKPLDFPVEVTGRLLVELYASSSCPDTDFMAKLTDVYPDGRSMLVQDGAIRARHRSSMESEKLLEPGAVYKFVIDLWSTSIVFNKGHRIRVDITSSNFPRFDPNPNTGHPFRADEETRIANNTIYFGESYPSRIILPLAGPDSDGDGIYDIVDPLPHKAGPIPSSDEVARMIGELRGMAGSVKDGQLRELLWLALEDARSRLLQDDLIGAGHILEAVQSCLGYDPGDVSLPAARAFVAVGLDEAGAALEEGRLIDFLDYVQAGYLLGTTRQALEGVRAGVLLGYLEEAAGLLRAGRPSEAVRLASWVNRPDVSSLAARIELFREGGGSESEVILIESIMEAAKDRFLQRQVDASNAMLSSLDKRLAGLGFPVRQGPRVLGILALLVFLKGLKMTWARSFPRRQCPGTIS